MNRSNRKKKTLGAGRWLRLVSEEGWEYVERVKTSGVVAIVAVTAADELVLTEQFRRPVAARVIDLPAGLVGDLKGSRNEELATAARSSRKRATTRAGSNFFRRRPRRPGSHRKRWPSFAPSA